MHPGAALREQCAGNELCEVGGGWSLEAGGKREHAWRAAAVGASCAELQRWECDDSEKEEWKNSKPGGGVHGVALGDEHEHKGADDCDGRNP